MSIASFGVKSQICGVRFASISMSRFLGCGIMLGTVIVHLIVSW